MKQLLESADTDSSASKFHEALSKAGRLEKGNWFFREKGHPGMLTGNYFANFKNVSPILGAIMDKRCAQSNGTPIKTCAASMSYSKKRYSGEVDVQVRH